ncbi:MAG TPA: type II toxin-antitoxin system PemK/MazF family toxin [Microvirga sp.]|nr:type II toxin-antitoxin system PemK/MazF family toxin [Microvirga sp.]
MDDLPSAGDIAWAELDPAHGTEQGGRRPVLVLTHRAYHERSRRALICPITSRVREWPFHVLLPDGLRIGGMILVDQVRMIDRSARPFRLIGSVPEATLAEVRARLAVLMGIPLGAGGSSPSK